MQMCVYVQENGYYLKILWLLIVHWLEDDDKKNCNILEKKISIIAQA